MKIAFGTFKQMFGHGWINTDILPMQEYAKGQKHIFQW